MTSELSPTELNTLIALSKRVLWGSVEVKKILQANGVNITPRNFYSNIPLVTDIEQSFEYIEEAAGIAPYASTGLFDKAQIAEFMRMICGYAKEFDPPREGDKTQPDGFFWENPAFSYSDAMAYYCILRALRPKRVVEIGSGFSTLVADQALRTNGDGEIVVIEPHPKEFLRKLPTIAQLIEQPVQNIPEPELVGLIDSCEVWFIDSTHTVKIGSDCLYIYLKIMPQVRSRVLCHSHDIFLPYAMPRKQALEKNVFWTEQYLLQAYLLDNPKAQVVFASRFVERQMQQECAELMAGRYPGGGGSLWYWIDGSRSDRTNAHVPAVTDSGSSDPNRLPA